jgi:hypothetical protein
MELSNILSKKVNDTRDLGIKKLGVKSELLQTTELWEEGAQRQGFLNNP